MALAIARFRAAIPDFRAVIPDFRAVIPDFRAVIPDFHPVIPAKAGIQRAGDAVGTSASANINAP